MDRTNLPHVVVLGTGGTIAGVEASDGSLGYDAGAVSIDALLEAVPSLEALARLSGKSIAVDSFRVCSQAACVVPAALGVVRAGPT